MKKVLFAFTLVSLLGCAGTRSNLNDAKQTPFSVVKLPCLGRCEELKATIYPSGKMVYEGFRNVDVLGKQTFELEVDRVKPLFEAVEAIDLAEFENCCTSTKRDLPGTSITYGQHRVLIKGKNNIPDELRAILVLVDELLEGISHG